jgi:hypothetical protein
MKQSQPSAEAFAFAAELIGCDVPAIQAVADVECGRRGAFFSDGAPMILFEAHKFHEYTGGRFDGARAPTVGGEAAVISRPTWKPGTYGLDSVQHRRLAAAIKLDRDAALMSTSWGLFQILGEHWKRCGYSSLQAFVNAAYKSVDDHLHMFVRFVRGSSAMAEAIRTHDWAAFARMYNGPGYKANRYDTKLAVAYGRFAASATDAAEVAQ